MAPRPFAQVIVTGGQLRETEVPLAAIAAQADDMNVAGHVAEGVVDPVDTGTGRRDGSPVLHPDPAGRATVIARIDIPHILKSDRELAAELPGLSAPVPELALKRGVIASMEDLATLDALA